LSHETICCSDNFISLCYLIAILDSSVATAENAKHDPHVFWSWIGLTAVILSGLDCGYLQSICFGGFLVLVLFLFEILEDDEDDVILLLLLT